MPRACAETDQREPPHRARCRRGVVLIEPLSDFFLLSGSQDALPLLLHVTYTIADQRSAARTRALPAHTRVNVIGRTVGPYAAASAARHRSLT